MTDSSRRIRLKQRECGSGEAGLVEAFITLLAAEGECPKDFETLRADMSVELRDVIMALFDAAWEKPAAREALKAIWRRMRALRRALLWRRRKYAGRCPEGIPASA